MSISCNRVGFNASLVAQIIKNTSKKLKNITTDYSFNCTFTHLN